MRARLGGVLEGTEQTKQLKQLLRVVHLVLSERGPGRVGMQRQLLNYSSHVSSLRGGEVKDIAFRTQEVLDQFERNPDQQKFMLTIIEKLDERSLAEPAAFSEVPLTLLSEVAQNGVQTLSSVSGDGMELCEQAMTTLLQSYIAERAPSEWKSLFKEATNIAFMVKYMFRESLPLAKEKFTTVVTNKENFKKMPNPAGVQEMLKNLVADTFFAYGNVGIFDPAQLADIDFLNQPELLVDLVMRRFVSPGQ